MDNAKTAVVYYSMHGNTDQTARKIAEATGADLIRLRPEKAYPDKGLRMFLRGGRDAVKAETPKLEPYAFDAGAYERVVIGFPVWAGTFAPPVRTFAEENREALRGMRVAAFACQSGSGAEKAFGKLQALLGIERLDATLVLVDPKSRPDTGNDRKIEAFISTLA